ncbi:hypothetical protein [Streptomyces sp. NBC_01006]|uniref:hypothetical protein n=1 Tax=Streptomyces sp. NBC_01006 TaxID=2903716 RepID=UPI003863E7F9|nr:hypothetical protein OG509_32030 [Streptomyces sp. NBC_01006]
MDSEEIARRGKELETYWYGENGFRQKYLIDMVPLPFVADEDVIGGRLIVATGDMRLRKVAEQFAGHFKRELRFDFLQFTATGSNRGQEVLLINSRDVVMLSPVACGAVGFDLEEKCLTWVWIHPFQRGRGLLDWVWEGLERRHGTEFTVEQPVSIPMQRFLQSKGVDPARWGGPSPTE